MMRVQSDNKVDTIADVVHKTVVLETYKCVSYETYAHKFMTVSIDIPNDGEEWHVVGEIL